jgi:ubiquitin-conjugating enzyme E2 J1
MADDKYNRKNPAVKRILQEVKEMQSNPSDDFMSLPLEENIFEWQFAIRGPSDTEFEGGIYHGRIQLPADYPFKPPSFMLLTPNGRFETQTKICLSISNHHPEHWQPSWSVRTALVALIAFMPTNPNGALGSLDFKKEERRILAVKSRESAPKYGSPERQRVIDEIHEYLLSKAASVSQVTPSEAPKEEITNRENEVEEAAENDGVEAVEVERVVEEPQLSDNVGPQVSREVGQIPPGPTQPSQHNHIMQRREVRVQKPADDRMFTWAAVCLTIAIAVLLFKKFMKANGHGAVFMDES